ncbi:hypothetical protein, partial [Mesorhizobium sp.]|uniref:hypothetical protein n=1 Tax=Mesorhizobium sp. TaxID=1871066 RepID=UPI00257D092C
PESTATNAVTYTTPWGTISKAAVAAFHRSPAPKPDPKTMIASQMRMIAHQEDRERWLEGYRKAGLPV